MTLRIWLRRLKRRYIEHKAIVLMYHRVARLQTDPWELAVDPANFEQQLQVLKKRFYVIPVNELLLQLQRGAIKRNCVCITFDDGYGDNFINAKPLLEKYKCPAAFFISTQYIGARQLYWWDELQQLLLEPYALPRLFSLVIRGVPFIYDLKEDAILDDNKKQRQRQWIASDDPPTRRCELYAALWTKLKPLPHGELQQAMDSIRLWAGGVHDANRMDLPLTGLELNYLASHPLFEIGLHTATHTSLPFHPREVQRLEINNNRDALAQLCNRRSKMLTYPYGDYNDTTIAVLKEERLAAAFNTWERVVTKRSDLYNLPRFQVKNWNGPGLEKQLLAWIKTY
jgi:peptidoglycan/xylan/chitin deacetylase (PgdA/CDA1 family)